MVGRIALFISCLLLFQATTAPVTILFYGDSLTAGHGLNSPDQAFPTLVEKKLTAQGKQVKVINAGLSGETSAGGLSRLDWVLRQPVDIFILELGANDGLRGLPLDQTRKNLQAIIDKVKAKNPDVKLVIAGMMVPPNLGADYGTSFQKIFPELAKKNNASLIPFLLQGVAGDEKLNISDGIHPNPAGHKILADNVLKVVGPLVK
ncbi:arylesterase [Dawidia soli]|uniref:Arylesterase n=1 Tax=Dawidia soli TaxID=2782352 RepID=A0AAP2DDY8_9BACT|nr:arylesterase [Dawidia soli]MBT1689010.1 arylesterase [Dawidia soli]